ncbi:MAG TPA: M28 family peptidase [Dehalococcoidia bacterium]|nr:M28 family peptidase [Dehalococcoidia bacterium]
MAAAEPALEARLPVGRVALIRLCRRQVVFAAICTLLLVLVAACGGGAAEPSPSPAATRTRAPTQAPTPSASPTPGVGNPEFDSARALELVRALSVDIGSRAAGTDGERRAATYIRDGLATYGYHASLQPFPIQSFVDVSTSLELLSPQQLAIEAQALGGSVSAQVEAQLVAAGLGYAPQFPAGTAGSIVLIERGEITFAEKVANATAAGAAAVIVHNNQSGPFFGQMASESRIPAASISREDGLALAELLSGDAVTARLAVEARTETTQSQNVVAKPPSGECRLVVGGHYDSVPAGPGANDNASGTAVVIEIARAMAADGAFDETCFVLFGAEEIGLIGSSHYVQSLTADELAGLKAMLNFDMLAVGDGWPLGGTAGIVDIAAQGADRLAIAHSDESGLPAGGGSDHASFIQAGVPAMLFNCFCDPNYHTAGDRFEFIKEDRLAEAGAMGLATAEVLLAR